MSLNQETFWSEHLNKAEKHPVSIRAYCRESGIKARQLYGYREGLQKKSKQAKPTKKSSTTFLPVQVQSQIDNTARSLTQPSAEWFAEFVLHLMRGAR